VDAVITSAARPHHRCRPRGQPQRRDDRCPDRRRPRRLGSQVGRELRLAM